jgi:CRISPR-associated Csx3 family protein
MEDGFKITDLGNWVFLEYFPEKVNIPSVINVLRLPKIENQKGIILAFEQPAWFLAFVFSQYLKNDFVSVFDFKLNAAVIIRSQNKNFKVGELLYII